MLKSPLSSQEYPEVSVNQALAPLWREWAGMLGRVALVNGITDEAFTYGELLANIRKIASGLRKLGLNKGDIVCIFSPNSPEWVFMFFAILANGASTSLLNPAYTAYELSHALKDSKPSYIYTIDSLKGTVTKAAKDSECVKSIIVLGDSGGCGCGCIDYRELLKDDGSAYPKDVVTNAKEDVAAIPYSSGTTGLPKGVMITHFNIVANLQQLGHPDYQDPKMADITQHVIVGYLPFFHVYGLVGSMVMGLAIGSKIVTMPKFVAEPFLALCEKHRVTVILLVPPVAVVLKKSPLLRKYNLSSVRIVSSGAAPLDKDLENEFGQSLKTARMHQSYGMTETTCGATKFLPNSPTKLGSCGVPLPDTEVQIVDLDSGSVLEANQRGEVWIRGPQIMKGYYNNPEATANTLDKNGWLHTGDIGYYDVDGYLFVVDRFKELIKYKGFQVAPAELEALLLNHPGVADVGVVGVPDPAAGEVPRAFVVKRHNSDVSEQELKDYVAEHFAKFKHLYGGVEFLSVIPKSPTGKILRRKLKEMDNRSNL